MKTEFEVKINKEIREYTESMFFGLSLRQFVCSLIACVVAVIVYFALKPLLGLETVSWVCILAAVPFAAMGFFSYNGLTAEKLLAAWIRSSILMPRYLSFGNTNLYYKMLDNPNEDIWKRTKTPGGRNVTNKQSAKSAHKQGRLISRSGKAGKGGRADRR